LVLTRSYYALNEKAFTNYINAHASTTYSGEEMKLKKQAKVNKNILLSKINANMLINCEEAIDKEQVVELQKYKDDPARFNGNKQGYSKLVAVNFPAYDVKPAEEGKLPEIQFTNTEQVMLSQIEEIND